MTCLRRYWYSFLFNLFILTFVRALNVIDRQKKAVENHVTAAPQYYLSNVTTVMPCIPYETDKFPNDFMTQQQRLKGGIIIHFLIAFYLSSVTAIISEYYSVPALELTVHYFNIPPDVGSAIILPISTSSAELFSCIIGAFITRNNVGIGTVIGTSAFNLLAITTLSTFLLKKKIILVDWYPITRDVFLFGCSIVIIILFLMDHIIEWWEAATLSTVFVIYIIIICLNKKTESIVREKISRLNATCCHPPAVHVVDHSYDNQLSNFGRASIDMQWMKPVADLQIQEQSEEVPSKLTISTQNMGIRLWWTLMWPAKILLFFTIPNCKMNRFHKLFPITFIFSTIWTAGISYVSVWMTTIIGYTFGMPVAVAGIIVLAVGAAIPQIVFGAAGRQRISADAIIAHQLQSNIFGLLLCLGIPWLIRCLALEKDMKIFINDQTIIYTFITLLSAVVIFWIVLLLIQWELSWKFGLICLILSAILIMLICFYQLNIIGKFRSPLCRH